MYIYFFLISSLCLSFNTFSFLYNISQGHPFFHSYPTYTMYACLAVFTLHHWIATPGFSSETGLYSNPCCLSLSSSTCFLRMLLWSLHFTPGKENGSILHFLLVTVYSPSWSHLIPTPFSPQGSRDTMELILLPSLSTEPLSAQNTSLLLCTYPNLIPVRTWLTSPWFPSAVFQSMLIMLPALPQRSLCCHEMLLFSVKTKPHHQGCQRKEVGLVEKGT